MASTFEIHKKRLAQLVRRRGGIHHAIEELRETDNDDSIIGLRFQKPIFYFEKVGNGSPRCGHCRVRAKATF
jgi:hypothetical protein